MQSASKRLLKATNRSTQTFTPKHNVIKHLATTICFGRGFVFFESPA